MPRPTFPLVDHLFTSLAAGAIVVATVGAAAGQSQSLPSGPGPSGTANGLRTFELPKPPAVAGTEAARELPVAPVRPPQASESLTTMIGVGYVQGADWGAEMFAGGSYAGAQVHLNTLLTSGRDGFRFDNGSLSIYDPNTQWHVEAGDVFSHLRGAALGGRLSWAAKGHRRPAVAVYAPRRGAPSGRTVITYRDQLQIKGQTLLDAEVASDKSYLLRSRLSASVFEVEAFHRRQREPFDVRDLSFFGGVRLWRGVSVNGGVFEAALADDHNRWRMIAVRVPVSRAFDLTLERAFAGSGGMSQTTSAVMTNVTAGNLRFFHRYQMGEYEFLGNGFAGSVERQQNRSMTSYAAGSRLNLTLQLATQRAETGQVEHWEELQATIKLTSTTTLRTVTAVPDFRNTERFQAYFRQQLPRRFALQADYGRISAYQSIARELDRSRLKLMLFKTLPIATPARGATVTGRVLDRFGHAVAGARVKLGPYTVDSNGAGVYTFAHVPRGDYELSLDSNLLPADFAWDGRGDRLTVTSPRTFTADLKVTPLNAIHGRVYVDANNNGRPDAGEGIANAVLSVADRMTASDADGAYSFYNLWPDAYTIRLAGVPEGYAADTLALSVTLLDGAPVTGANLRVVRKDKPIIWASPGR